MKLNLEETFLQILYLTTLYFKNESLIDCPILRNNVYARNIQKMDLEIRDKQLVLQILYFKYYLSHIFQKNTINVFKYPV